MSSTLIDAFELLLLAEQLGPRLEAAAAVLAQLPDLAEERGWLAAARARLATATATSHQGLLDRALRLPELEAMRGERGKLLQAAIADEFERLQAAITVVGGARSPVLEMLLHNLKVPALRKCGRAELDKFCAEVQRRVHSSYTRRVLTGERWREVAQRVPALEGAIATWRAVFVEPPLDEAAAAPLREELAAAARAIEREVKQASLLARAALLPATDLLDGAGLLTVVGMRRGADAAPHPLLTQDPPDPLLPTAAERAELADAHAPS